MNNNFNSLEIIQLYRIESYAKPGSDMEDRAAYQFARRQIADAFDNWANNRRFGSLIDIGSSTGFLTKRFKHHADVTIAVDVEDRVLQAIGDPGILTIQDSLPHLRRLTKASADVVISTDTLYLLSALELRVALRRIAEILRPDGYFIFNDNGKADDLVQQLEQINPYFRRVTILKAPVSLKSSPNFERMYWNVEAKYLFCRGLFLALKDPHFDVARDLSELRERRLVHLCLRNRWLEHFLWLLWPLRQLARLMWASPALVKWLCVKRQPCDCLWVYQRTDSPSRAEQVRN